MKYPILTDLGLSRKEADTYETLLRLGPSTISKLVENTPYKRGDMYNILAGLEGFELIQQNDKVYSPVHPSKLESLVYEQEKEVEQTKKGLQAVLSNLVGSYHLHSNRPGVQFFEGKQGFQHALADSLTATECIYTFIDVVSVSKYVDDINKRYAKKRKKLGKDKKILMLDSQEARAYMRGIGTDHTTTRFLPRNMNPFRTGLQIYDNKIAYFTLRQDNIMSVIIEDKDIYDLHRSLFDFLWKLQEKSHLQTTKPFSQRSDGSAFN